MNIILWGIFYIATTIFLLYFFLREKQVIDYIRGKEDILLKKIYLKESSTAGRNISGNIITVVALVLAGIFFFIVDRTPDTTIKIKNWGIYGVFAVNIVFYILRKEHEWIFLVNLVMMFLGRLMFNILDMNFYIYMGINIVLSGVLIYLFRRQPVDTVTKESLLDEARKNSEKLKEITDETVETEKMRRSTLGKAFHRIDTAVTAIVLVGLIQTFYIGNYVIPSGSMEPTIQIQDRVFANMIKYKFTSPKIGQIIAFKEPMNNQVMYTKRLTGSAGDTMQIISGRMVINGKPSEILNRYYEPEGIFYDKKIYVPKKGDKVKLDKIIMIGKLTGYTDENQFVAQADWNGYNEGETYEELTPEDFLGKIGVNKGYKDIIGNENSFNAENSNDPIKNVYYTFTLKAEGRDETVLPIMDFKHDDELFNRLLRGEAITLTQNYYMAMGDNTGNSYDSRYFGYVSENRIRGELLLRWWPLNRIGLLR